MKLSDLTKKTAKTPMPYGDEGDMIVFRPHVISTDFLLEMNSLAEKVTDKDEMESLLEKAISLICELLVSWDLTDDDGDRIPVTPEAIREHKVSFIFLVAALQAGTTNVGEASAPTSGAISEDTSSRVVSLARSRTGTH